MNLNPPIPVSVKLVVIISTLLLTTGAVLGKVAPEWLAHGSPISAAARVFADYMFARNLPIALMLLLLLMKRSRKCLACLLVLTAMIQALDIINNLARQEFVLVPGLLIFLSALLWGARKLLPGGVFNIGMWLD